MKKFKPLSLCAFALLATAYAGDRAGNGGDFDEMQFVTLAYQDLDALRTLNKQSSVPVDLGVYVQKLQRLRVNFVDDVKLADGPRSAVNFPNEDVIDVDSHRWQQHTDRLDRLNLVLHEMLWICGVKDQSYVVSTSLFEKMKPLLQKQVENPSTTPVLLASYEMDDPTQGMDKDTAATTCQQQKDIYKDQYYFVYCVYYERDQDRIALEPFDDQTRVFLHNHHLDEEYEHDNWHSLPVTVTDTYYGLRVFGLGEMDTLRWKVVASSTQLAGGLVSASYPTHIEAMLACQDRLASEDQTSIQFNGAVCRAVQSDNGSYIYQIVTKNPLVQGKE